MKQKNVIVNPYLPEWEYVPDAEAHVFGDRLYIYGSHDSPRGSTFCEENYVGWSTSVNDPGSWQYHGCIYDKTQDPLNRDGAHALYAPDAVKGPDGRYYLYYGLDFTNVISVAVCDTPMGKYQFYGHVVYADQISPTSSRMFDPAVLCEGNHIYLYFGFCPTWRFPGMDKAPFPGAMAAELEKDMCTIKSTPVCIINSAETCKGTEFEEHPFFEASSIRQFHGIYYFVYSSIQSHELCYATSHSPMGPFKYRGVIISNGDIGYNGRRIPVNYMGNNHGGIERIGDKYYIFYHRHTHGTQFSRQGCAEEITLGENGEIPQVEMTSCGLNEGNLPADGVYSAGILCCLMGPDRHKIGMVGEKGHSNALPDDAPFLMDEKCDDTEGQSRLYAANLQNGSVWGFKFIEFSSAGDYTMTVTVRGCDGDIQICLGNQTNVCNVLRVEKTGSWTEYQTKLTDITGIHALYFCLLCKSGSAMEFLEFSLKPYRSV